MPTSKLLPNQQSPSINNKLGPNNTVIFNTLYGNNKNVFGNNEISISAQDNTPISSKLDTKANNPLSDEDYAIMLMHQEYDIFAKDEDTKLNLAYNDFMFAQKLQQELDDHNYAISLHNAFNKEQEADDALIARLLQEDEDFNYAKSLQAIEDQLANDAAIARMLQEDEDFNYAKSLQAIEDQTANDAAIARMLQEDGNDSAYALQLYYDSINWA